MSIVSSPLDMFSTLRSVIPRRASEAEDRVRGSHSNPNGSSSDSSPRSTIIPIRVTAMLLAADHVRVLVPTFAPFSYRS